MQLSDKVATVTKTPLIYPPTSEKLYHKIRRGGVKERRKSEGGEKGQKDREKMEKAQGETKKELKRAEG